MKSLDVCIDFFLSIRLSRFQVAHKIFKHDQSTFTLCWKLFDHAVCRDEAFEDSFLVGFLFKDVHVHEMVWFGKGEEKQHFSITVTQGSAMPYMAVAIGQPKWYMAMQQAMKNKMINTIDLLVHVNLHVWNGYRNIQLVIKAWEIMI